MNKLYYILSVSLFALFAIETTAQTTHIPDAKFRQALTYLNIGVVFVGDNATTSTISAIQSLDVSEKK